MQEFTIKRSPPVQRKTVTRRIVLDQIGSFLFVVPFLLAFVLFVGYPIVFGVYISLNHWNPIVGSTGFAGLSQYLDLFNMQTLAAQQFWDGLKNTSIFVVISVPLLLFVPLVLAFILYRSPLKNLFRPIFFFPSVLSATAVTSVWTWLLQTQGGGINQLFGLQIPWLVEQPWAWISIDIATVWWSMGFNLVIIYAGLTQLPISTLEAAAIDGARSVRLFFSIVIPQLRHVIAFVVVTSTIASFNLFAQSLLMTGGGPGSSTESLSMYIYNQGFNAMHMGSASAMAYLMGLVLAIVSFVQYRLTREANG